MATGFDKIKDGLSQAVEPAIVFAETGSQAAASWSLLQTVILTKVLGPLSLVSGALLAINGSMKLFLGRTEAVAKGIEKIRRLEILKTQFQPLLGGAASAQKKIEELFTFAASTPFQLEEIAEASRTLEVLTKGGASGMKSLRMIGDAAAVSGQSMQTVSFWVGRTFDALKSNAPIGEATARLQEMGLITGDVRRKLQASAEAGESFTTTFKILTDQLEKAEGGMLELSKTLGGLESTLADVRGKFAAGFAKDFAVAEKANIRSTIGLLELLQPAAEVVGQNFAIVANGIAKFKESIINALNSTKGLKSNLAGVTSGIFVFAGAVAAVQFTAIVKGLFELGRGVGAANIALKAFSIGSAMSATAGKGFIATLKVMAANIRATTIAGTLQNVVAFGLVGTFRLLSFAVGMAATAFKTAFVAMVNSPLALLISSLGALAGAIMVVRNSAEQHEQAMQDLAEQADQTKERIDNLIESFKTVSDVEAGFAQIEQEIAGARVQVEKLIEKISELGVLDKMLGKDEDLAAQLQRSVENLNELRGRLQQVASIEATQLQIGKEKINQLRRQVELTSDLQAQSHDLAMSRATEQEQITLMVDRQQQLSKELEVGTGAEQSLLVQDQINAAAAGLGDGSFPALEAASDQAKNAKDAIEEAKNELALFLAKQAEIEGTFVQTATQEDVDAGNATEVGQQILNKQGRVGSEVIKFVSDDTIAEFDALIEQIKLAEKEAKAFEKAIKALKVDAAGGNFITPEAIDELDRAGVSLDSLLEKQRQLEESGSESGLLAALKARKANNTDADGNQILDARQLQVLEEAIQQLEKQREAINANAAAVKRLQFEREELARQQQLAIDLMLIERGLHQEMMSISERGFQVEQRRLQAQLSAAKQRLELQSSKGNVAASTERMEKERDELQNVDTSDMTEKEKKAIEDKIASLEKAIATQKEFNKEVEQAAQEVDRLKKKLKETEEEALVKLKTRIAEIIAKDLDLDAEIAIRLGNIDEAAAKLEALNAINDDLFAQQRMTELRKEGQSPEDAAAIVAKEVQQREAQRAEQRAVKTQTTEEDLRIEQLRTRARVFGDRGAGDQATALEARRDFRKEVGESLAMGMSREDAVANAMKKIDTELLSKVPEAKVTADSFRRIGAGGFGSATDPMKMLAEKRNRVLEELAKDIRKMLNVDEEILKKDDNIRLL